MYNDQLLAELDRLYVAGNEAETHLNVANKIFELLNGREPNYSVSVDSDGRVKEGL